MKLNISMELLSTCIYLQPNNEIIHKINSSSNHKTKTKQINNN